jgi:hypothetical protein
VAANIKWDREGTAGRDNSRQATGVDSTADPPPLRRVIQKGKRGDVETEVLDHGACSDRRIFPYQKGYRELAFFVVHRGLAEKITEARFRDLGWRSYATTNDRAVKQVLRSTLVFILLLNPNMVHVGAKSNKNPTCE